MSSYLYTPSCRVERAVCRHDLPLLSDMAHRMRLEDDDAPNCMILNMDVRLVMKDYFLLIELG